QSCVRAKELRQITASPRPAARLPPARRSVRPVASASSARSASGAPPMCMEGLSLVYLWGSGRMPLGPRCAAPVEAPAVPVPIGVANRSMHRFGHPVNHGVGEQFIFAEAPLNVLIAVAPRAELLHDPASQANR